MDKVMNMNQFLTLTDPKGLEITLDAQAPVCEHRVQGFLFLQLPY